MLAFLSESPQGRNLNSALKVICFREFKFVKLQGGVFTVAGRHTSKLGNPLHLTETEVEDACLPVRVAARAELEFGLERKLIVFENQYFKLMKLRAAFSHRSSPWRKAPPPACDLGRGHAFRALATDTPRSG
jgi:hypothetical protein